MNQLKLLLFFVISIVSVEKMYATNDTLTVKPFGKLVLYKPKNPERLVLFISGDGGWNKGMDNMAKQCRDDKTLVIGIDMRSLMKTLQQRKQSCLYPAADFENLSKLIQKRMGFHEYYQPLLVGFSSGATLVYGLLAQSPANTFRGGVVLGFCPDMQLDRPLCKGSGLECHPWKKGCGYDLQPVAKLSNLMISLQGTVDKVCDFTATTNFLKQVGNTEEVVLTNVGHGYSVEKNWVPQFHAAVEKLLIPIVIAPVHKVQQGDAGNDLPLILSLSSKDDSMPLVFLISGDGGWTGFDQGFATGMTMKGMPVIGFDALKYFWTESSPAKTAKVIVPVIRYYMNLWHRDNIVLAGYSFGADAMPFIYQQLPPDLKENVKSLVLLSPSTSADFEIHVSDMLSIGSSSDDYNVAESLKLLKGPELVAIFGEDEEPWTKTLLSPSQCRTVVIPGGHHFNDDYNALTNEVLKTLH